MNPFLAGVGLAVFSSALMWGAMETVFSDVKYHRAESGVRPMVLVGLKAPKRFKVRLQDAETGVQTGLIYVSKRCSRWEEMRPNLGKTYNVHYTVYRNKAGDSYADYHVRSFCPGN